MDRRFRDCECVCGCGYVSERGNGCSREPDRKMVTDRATKRETQIFLLEPWLAQQTDFAWLGHFVISSHPTLGLFSHAFIKSLKQMLSSLLSKLSLPPTKIGLQKHLCILYSHVLNSWGWPVTSKCSQRWAWIFVRRGKSHSGLI